MPFFAALLLHAAAALADVRRIDDAIVFEGRIDERSAATFLRLAQDAEVKRLVITSYGGLVAPALAMAEVLDARQLDIEVPSACLSSCANYLFPAARHKVLGHAAAVAWHGNMAHVLWLAQTGQGSWSTQELDAARELAAREARLYERIGVDGFICWFGKIAPYGVDDFYAMSVQDMERFGLHDVTVRSEKPIASDTVSWIHVDWSRLEADRPAVHWQPARE
jgi:hypothetical protein